MENCTYDDYLWDKADRDREERLLAEFREINKAIADYNNACNKIVELFSKKHRLEFDGWVNEEAGEIAEFNSFYLQIRDIIYDLKTNQTRGKIFDWYEQHFNGAKRLSYKAFCQLKK